MKECSWLDIEWNLDGCADNGTLGYWETKQLAVKITVEKKLSPHQIVATMLHEVIEIINRISGGSLQHDEIDTFAQPIADIIIEGGFDPYKVIKEKPEDK